LLLLLGATLLFVAHQLSFSQNFKSESGEGVFSIITDEPIDHWCPLPLFHEYEVNYNSFKKTLVWFCRKHCGGNSDRLHGITLAFWLALESDAKLRIEWEHPFDISKIFSPRVVHVPWEKIAEGERDKVLLKNQLRLPRVNFEDLVNPKEWFLNSSLVAINSNQFFRYKLERLDGKVKNAWLPKDFELGCSFHYLFTPSQQLQDLYLQTKAAYDSFLARFDDPKIVSIHIRSGDQNLANVESGDLRHCDVDLFFKCAEVYEKKFEFEEVVWFLSTDNFDLKFESRKRYGHKLFTTDFEPIHTDKVEKGENALQGTLESWVELFLLAKGDALIMSKSGNICTS